MPGLHRKSIARPCRQLQRCQDFFRFFWEVEVPPDFFPKEKSSSKVPFSFGGRWFLMFGIFVRVYLEKSIAQAEIDPF